MENPAFRPFETLLPEDEALPILRETLAGAEDGEIFAERHKSEALMFDDGRLRSASYDASEGFGLRAVNGEVAGYAHSTEVSIAALKRELSAMPAENPDLLGERPPGASGGDPAACMRAVG